MGGVELTKMCWLWLQETTATTAHIMGKGMTSTLRMGWCLSTKMLVDSLCRGICSLRRLSVSVEVKLAGLVVRTCVPWGCVSGGQEERLLEGRARTSVSYMCCSMQLSPASSQENRKQAVERRTQMGALSSMVDLKSCILLPLFHWSGPRQCARICASIPAHVAQSCHSQHGDDNAAEDVCRKMWLPHRGICLLVLLT